MAAIPVTIRGKIITKSPKGGEVSPSGAQDCVVQGSLSITGLHVDIKPPEVQPPDPVEPPEPNKRWEAKTFWTPENGWQVVLVPGDDTNVPTPSK